MFATSVTEKFNLIKILFLLSWGGLRTLFRRTLGPFLRRRRQHYQILIWFSILWCKKINICCDTFWKIQNNASRTMSKLMKNLNNFYLCPAVFARRGALLIFGGSFALQVLFENFVFDAILFGLLCVGTIFKIKSKLFLLVVKKIDFVAMKKKEDIATNVSWKSLKNHEICQQIVEKSMQFKIVEPVHGQFVLRTASLLPGIQNIFLRLGKLLLPEIPKLFF